MNSKGYTLIEVIVAIVIIALLAVAFLPLITFSYTNLVGSQKYTEDMLEDQSIVENKIDALRFSPPTGSDYVTAFEVNVPVHILEVNTTSSGQVKVYLPKQTVVPVIPIIKSPPQMIVRTYGNSKVSPQPNSIHIFDDLYKLFVADVDITIATKNDHLMNVYRWYTSAEVTNSEEVASETTDDYVVVREWNEAKTVLGYSEALSKGFIPNMKEYTDSALGKEQYNEFNYQILKNVHASTIEKGLDEEEYKRKLNEKIINNYGNRYIRYGVTPYSLTGRMGREELSNAIYIEAPRIEIVSAQITGLNDITIEFDWLIEDIEADVDLFSSSILLNESLGNLNSVEIDDEDEHKLILVFEDELNNSSDIDGNVLNRGAIIFKDYGAIYVWSNEDLNGEFTISAED